MRWIGFAVLSDSSFLAGVWFDRISGNHLKNESFFCLHPLP